VLFKSSSGVQMFEERTRTSVILLYSSLFHLRRLSYQS